MTNAAHSQQRPAKAAIAHVSLGLMVLGQPGVQLSQVQAWEGPVCTSEKKVAQTVPGPKT